MTEEFEYVCCHPLMCTLYNKIKNNIVLLDILDILNFIIHLNTYSDS